MPCTPLDYDPLLAIGVLVEVDDKYIKVFDVKYRKLRVIRNTYDPDRLVLGQRKTFEHMKISNYPKGRPDVGNVIVEVEEGHVITFKTVAISPNPKDIREEIFQKYKGKIWSPYLGYLRDPKNLFGITFNGGELGWIEAKYAPDGDTLFELYNADCLVQLNDDELARPPWVLENWNQPLELRQIHPKRVVRTEKYKFLSRIWTVRFGICVETGVQNEKYSRKNIGSTPKCAHMVSLALGMYRCIQEVKLGSWYQHTFVDNRTRWRKEGKMCAKPAISYMSLTATKLFEVDAPLPTKVKNGRVQMTVKFPFDHDALEREWSRKVEDRDERREGLRNDSHFWNEYIGRVEIGKRKAWEIVKAVESYRRGLPEPFKSEPLTVVVTVKLHHNHYENNLSYPEDGLFLVSKVKKLKDSKGKTIRI